MLTSCEKDKSLPKCYDLIADEYKEILLDPDMEAKLARIVQDQGEKFTIDSPKEDRNLQSISIVPTVSGQKKKHQSCTTAMEAAMRQATLPCTAMTSAKWQTGLRPRYSLRNIR